MATNGDFTAQFPDPDPQETAEWLDSLSEEVVGRGGNRARYLLWRLMEEVTSLGIEIPDFVATDFVNTIPASAEPAMR